MPPMLPLQPLIEAVQRALSRKSALRISALVAAFAAARLYYVNVLLPQRERGSRRRQSAVHSTAAMSPTTSAVPGASAEKKEKKIAVDRVFVSRLLSTIRTCIPSWRSKEALHLGLLTGLLLGRTMLSIKMADVIGDNAKSLVERKKEKFIWGVITLGLWSIPASVVNSGLKFEEDYLSLCFRRRLTRDLHRRYLSDNVFYKSLSSVQHADARITQDIALFSSNLSALYSNIFKPTLDVVLFTKKLATVVGLQGPIMMVLYYLCSGVLMRAVMPNFAKITAQRQALESEFRFCHTQLVNCAEEVAFYSGGPREEQIINGSFDRLYAFSKRLYSIQFFVEIFNAFLVKYGATMVGYGVCALPVFFQGNRHAKKSSTELTQDYVRNSQLLINLARAIGALVLLYKRVTSLAGYTARVAELRESVDRVLRDKSHKAPQQPGTASAVTGPPTEGRMEVGGQAIEFRHVDIITPDGQTVLARDVNFRVEPGVNVVIAGPNGCGKSSLFRILGELWDVHPATGVVCKPQPGRRPGGSEKTSARSTIFYVPQRPYFPLGSLRDQVLYPQSVEDALKTHGLVTVAQLDEMLLDLLKKVNLQGVAQREGLMQTRDWYAVLSGGEKQRLAMTRVYYHRPQFAILDECTSAVSDEMRHEMYRQCHELGITVFSVVHQKDLYRHHQRILRFDGQGHVFFEQI